MSKGKKLWSLLFTKELSYLAGRRASNLITLFGISFLSLTAISIAYSSEKFLNYRMNDPFTNWLNIPKLSTIEEQTWQKLAAFLEKDPRVREEYDIASVSRNFNATLTFFDRDLQRGPLLYGETFHPSTDSTILSRINGGVPVDKEAYSQGIILSEAGLNKLGYEWEERDNLSKVWVHRSSALSHEVYVAVPLEVVAVVPMLPDRREFIVHPELNFKLEKSARRSHLYSEDNTAFGLGMLTDVEEGAIEGLRKSIEAVEGVRRVRQREGDAFAPYRFLELDLAEKMDYMARYTFFAEAVEGILPESSNALMVMLPSEFLWQAYSSSAAERYHQNYVVNFSSLKSIRKFSDTMMENFSYPVDLATVEAKENFSLTSITTLALVFCLLLFALLSILIFLRSMLKAHLEKIAPNLGTMLAFGMHPAALMRNYVLISASMVLFVLLLSLLILVALSGFFTDALIAFLDIDGMDTRVLSFQAINLWTLLTFALVLLGAVGITAIVSRKILNTPPSNLIYGRI